MRKIAKKLGMLFAVGIVSIGISGCAQTKPEQVLGTDPLTGAGTHILELPTLGQELETEFAKREKIWVRRIFIHSAPQKEQFLWSKGAKKTAFDNLNRSKITHHQSSYYLSDDMRQNLNRVLGLYYHISPNSDLEVDIKLSVKQSGTEKKIIFVGDFMEVSTKFSLRVTESLGKQVKSDKIFIGYDRDHVGIHPGGKIFPNKMDAEESLMNAYQKLWKDFLKG